MNGSQERWPLVGALFLQMKESRVPPDGASISIMATSLVQAGHWRSALQILELPSPSTAVTFHSIMHALGENSLWEWALLLLRSLCRGKLGLRASEMSFSVAIGACQHGAVWQGSMDLLGQAMCTVGCTSTITWNPALSACELQGLWQRSLAALQRMPGMRSRARAAKACARASAWAAGLVLGWGQEGKPQQELWREPHGPWERMARLLGLGFQGCPPSRARWQTALEALQAGRRRHIEVDQVDFNAAVSACEKDVDTVEQSPGTTWRYVLCLLDEAEKHTRPDCITFSAAISILDEARWWKKALASYDGLLSKAVQPGGVTFNALAGTLETARHWPEALLLLEAMDVGRVSPDNIFFGVLLKSSSGFMPADQLWAQMQSRRIASDAVACASAIEGLVLDMRVMDSTSMMPTLQDLGIEVLHERLKRGA
ncbi:unnamed protein product [Symbiodinium microadriaticum]|nr:unnamed protein product [Symbiodinium sp. KB8]CAE7862644.1 unnamed protein product [Symbiodinium microadriaticum]